MTPGEELRAAREAMGLTIEEVSARTRIHQRYLEALERDDTTAFPPGPFLVGFSKKYRTLVGLGERTPLAAQAPDEPTHTVTSPARPSSTTRRRATRAAVIGGLAVLAVLVLIRAYPASKPAAEPALGEPMDLAVQVNVTEAVRARVYADGDLKFADAIKPGPGMQVAGRDKVSVELETLEGVDLQFQGKPLKPLGHQSRPRRLVFIDDGQ